MDVNILTDMRYYIYKLTFKSGATYIGQHIEKTKEDGYISSSSYMSQHPEDPIVSRDILVEVKDKSTLDIMETLCIRADKADNPKNVNKNFGNWDYKFCFKGFHHSDKTKTLLSNAHYKPGSDIAKNIGDKNRGRKNTEETKQLMSESAKASWTEERRKATIESGNYSHPHSDETKNRLSEIRTGKIWIHRGKETKSIKPELLEDFIKDGWEKGRGKLK